MARATARARCFCAIGAAFVALGMALDHTGVSKYPMPGRIAGGPPAVGTPLLPYVLGIGFMALSLISACLVAAEARNESRKSTRK